MEGSEAPAKPPFPAWRLSAGLGSLALLLLLAFLGGRLIDAVLLLLLILTHELAHLAVAAGFGCRILGLRFSALGGTLILGGEIESDPAVEALIAAAGPLHHLLLMILAGLAGPFPAALGAHWSFFVRANLTLALFNCLPIHPLDGGRLLHAALRRHLAPERAHRVIQRISLVASATMILIGIGLAVQGKGPWLLACGTYLAWQRRRPESFALAGYLRMQADKRVRLHGAGFLPLRTFLVGAQAKIWPILRRTAGRRYGAFLVVDVRGRIIALASEEQVMAVVEQCGPRCTFSDLIRVNPHPGEGRRCGPLVESVHWKD